MKILFIGFFALVSSVAAFAVPPHNLCEANTYSQTFSREFALAYTTTTEEEARDGVSQDVMDDYCNRSPYWDGNVQVSTACLLETRPGSDRLDVCIGTYRLAY